MGLIEIRKDKDMTLREVGEKMGCSHTAVSKLEKSKNPGIITLDKYAKALGVPFTVVVDCVKKMSTECYQNA